MNSVLRRTLPSRIIVALVLLTTVAIVSGFMSLMVNGPAVSSPTFSPNPIPIAGGLVHVSAKVTDSTSAVSHVKVRVNDASGNFVSDTPAKVALDGVTYSADVSVAPNLSNSRDGVSLSVYADDVAGNNSGYVLVATQGHDTTPPVITSPAASPNPIPIKGATIHVTAKVADASLAVQYVKARIRDSAGNTVSEKTAVVASDGLTYSADVAVPANLSNSNEGQRIYVVAADTANNLSSEVLVDSQSHDTTPPVITSPAASPNPIPIKGATIHVTAKVADASLAVQYVRARIRDSAGNLVADTVAGVASDGVTYSADVTVPANRSNSNDGQRVYVVAADTANNLSSEVLVDSQTHDTTPPDISNIAYSPNPIPVTGATVHISATVVDVSLPVASVVFNVRDVSGNAVRNVTGQVGSDGQTYSGDVLVDPNTRADRIGESIFITATDAAGNAVTVLGAFQDNRPHLSGFTVTPNSVTGGTSSTGTVVVDNPALTGGFVVSLASDNVAATVPATVTIASGATTGTFTVATVPVPSATSAKLSASAGTASLTQNLGIAPPVLSGLALSPAFVFGGDGSTGTVTLSGPAPTGGTTVSLASNNLAATVPPSVTIPAGGSSATFAVTTTAVSSNVSATISAVLNGVTKTAKLGVDAPQLTSLITVPPSVYGGASSTCTVTLTGIAPGGGAVVILASDSAFASVPTSVTVAAGSKTATFTVTTQPVATTGVATLSASFGVLTKTAKLTVNAPYLVSEALSPATVLGGAPSTGTVTLNAVAPTGGLTVSLASDSTFATVPASVVVAAGAKTATFTVTTKGVLAPSVATLTATLGAVTKTATLNVTATVLSTFRLSIASVFGGTSLTGTVTLTGVAPDAGASVTLASDSTFAGIPTSVSVPGGATSASFTITTTPVSSDSTATLTASLGSVSKTAALGVKAPVLILFGIAPTSVKGGTSVNATVTLNSPAPAAGTVVTLASDLSFATVPASATVPAGTKLGKFTISTSAVATGSTAVISATLGSVSKTASLTVMPPSISSLSISPTSLYGGATSVGTVTLSDPAPTGGFALNLASDSAFATVPTTVAGAAGATTATFSISTVPVTAAGNATVTASDGTVAKSAILAVNPPKLSSVVLNPTTVNGGSSSTGTITLGSAAPTGGTVVTLSSDSASATVPASATLAAGSTTATFTVTTSVVSTSATANISATLGSDTSSAALTINVVPPTTLTLSPNSIEGGNVTTGTITLGTPAPSGGKLVGITSSNFYAFVPSSVTVPAGATTATFAVQTPAVGAYKTTTISAVGLTTATLTVAPSGYQPGASWPSKGRNSQRTSFGFGPRSNGALKWAFSAGGPLKSSSPVIAADGTMYVGSDDNKLYAINPDGTLRWTFATGGVIDSSPAIGSDGTVYVGSDDNHLYAVNPDGSQKWSVPIDMSHNGCPLIGADGTIYMPSLMKVLALKPDGTPKWVFNSVSDYFYGSAAIAPDGTVYLGSFLGSLYAINSDGTLKWKAINDINANFGDVSPAIAADGTIYLGSINGKLYAVNPDSSTKWTYTTGGELRESSPAIGPDGTVYVGSRDLKLHAVLPNGVAKWTYPMGSASSSPSISGDGTIYLAGWDGKIHAVNADGSEKWTYVTGDTFFLSSPAIGNDGTIYIGSQGNKIYALGTSSPWPMLNHDTQHSGRGVGSGSTGSLKWSFATGSSVHSSPVIGEDGTVFLGSDDHNVYAFNGSNGAKKWTFATDNAIYSSPAIGAEGTVYVGSGDHNVYALDGITGAKKWSFATGSYVDSSPVIGADGTVYVGSGDHNVYALDGITGTKKWSFVTGSDVESSPAIAADGTVYIGSGDSNVYALDGVTGAKKWSFTAGDGIYSSVALGADGTVYVESFDGNIYALDGVTGAKKWMLAGSFGHSSPAIGDDGTVYVGSWDSNVYALDGSTGAKKWSFATGQVVVSTPAIGADGTVYVGSFDHSVYALDGNTGAKKWSFATGDIIYANPAIGADGTVYVGSNDFKIYALGRATPSPHPSSRQYTKSKGK